MSKLRFISKCFNEPPPFLRKNYAFYIFNYYMLRHINCFKNIDYNVENLLDDDLETLISGIYFVHNCYIFNE